MDREARFLLLLLCAAVGLAACANDAPPAASPPPDVLPATGTPSEKAPGAEEEGDGDALPRRVSERPSWLGERVLEVGPDGFGIAHSTPEVLRDRRLESVDYLPPPRNDHFDSSVGAVPRDVLERSTWQRACPVSKGDLAYVKTAFWGFDREPHSGELLVHRSVATDVVSVFRTLYRHKWPIEEMRVTSRSELDAPPTGDGNNTSAFVCRPARQSQEWSEHAYGLAIDVNPFHNPYVRDDVVLPELALVYRNRGWHRPGMIHDGDVVTRAFARIGWGWGGDWSSAKDWMHFSRSGD